VDVDAVGRGEKIAAGSAIALFLIMFIFDWFGFGGTVDTGIGSVEIGGGFNAWESFDGIDIVLMLAIIAAVGVAAMSAYGTSDNLPVAGSAVVTGLAALATVLILYRIIDPPSGADREIGVFLGLIASAAMTYGGWEAMQEESAYVRE
jgi:multisubunit Na+/H+ antiporter MnhF subunit